MPNPRVVAVCGSLRKESYTRKALQIALDAASERGATTELLDLREWDLPVIDPDLEDAGESQAFKQRVREADSILLGTPMYHGSYSAPLKNALDHCGFDEFENKTVGLLCVAGGSFPITALDHLRSVCRALDSWVIPHQAALPEAHSAFDGDQITDDGIEDRVVTLGEEAVEYASIRGAPASMESCENVGAND
jgi:NAD(P)H-dependent FMN reductase